LWNITSFTAKQLPSRQSLKQHLQFEMNCLKLYFLDDSNIWDFYIEYNHIVHMLFFWSNLVYMGNQSNLKFKIKFATHENIQLGWLWWLWVSNEPQNGVVIRWQLKKCEILVGYDWPWVGFEVKLKPTFFWFVAQENWSFYWFCCVSVFIWLHILVFKVYN
jgi:hypothetical protein